VKDESAVAGAPLVDTHAHIFVPDLPLVDDATNRPPYSASDKDYIAALDGAGVRYGVIAAPSFLGSYMDYTLDCMRRESRLRATAIVAPDVSMDRLKELDRGGVVGIRYSLRRYRNVPDFSAPEYRGLLSKVADLGWHVHVLAEPDRMAVMVPALAASGVNVLVDHFGVPSGPQCPGLKAVLQAVQGGRTWVRMSAPYRLEPAMPASELAPLFLREAGADRLLWGSDWPWVAHEGQCTYADLIRDYQGWVPDAKDRARIDQNALSLYRFKAP